MLSKTLNNKTAKGGGNRAKVELVFIRSTRNDDASALAGCLCRSELLEAVVRLATSVFNEDQDVGANPAHQVSNFLQKYV